MYTWFRAFSSTSFRSSRSSSVLRNAIRPARSNAMSDSFLARRLHGSMPNVGAFFRGDVARSRSIMRFCIVTSIGVFAAWNWSGKEASFIPGGTREQKKRVQKFLRKNFTFKQDDLSAGRFWTPLTSALSHINPAHLVGNMFSFHAFSTLLIYSGIPPLRYAALIIGAAVAGDVGDLWQQRNSRRKHSSLGMSGAIMGVGTAAALAAPMATVSLFGVVPIPMAVLIIAYAFYDSYYMDDPTSMVGHAAHLGGGAFGAAFYALALRRALPWKIR